MDFATRFDPKEAEDRLYKFWEKAASSPPTPTLARPHLDVDPSAQRHGGALHMGHALNNTLQDILAR
jgi:valyl-tRNA synthetase